MNILDELFKFHDELSCEAVFSAEDTDRQTAFTKAESIREALERIKDSFEQKEQDKYTDAVREHYKSFGKGLFYNRRLTFKE